MKLLMISGDRRVAAGESCAFLETLTELHTHFDRIDIICPRVHGANHVRSLLGNVYVHASTKSLLFQPSFILRKGRELFAAHQHDVMTVHDYPPFYNGLGARRLMKKTGIPAVLEIHHIVGWPRAASFSEWIGRAMSRWFLPSHCTAFRAVRVVSTVTKDVLVTWGVAPACLRIVPSMYLDHAEIEQVLHTPKRYDLAFCARLVPNKGLIAVIDAVASMPTATLVIVGDGPMRKQAEERVRALRLEERVTFTGWLPTHVDALKAVASARIFVMNSTSEGGPRSAVEAMALGLPILTTSVGLMPELVQDGVQGFFVDGSAKDLAMKTEVLLQDAALVASMGRTAMQVMDRFEKKSAVKMYADFLQSFARP